LTETGALSAWKHALVMTTGKRVIDLLVKEGIGTQVIGKNNGWKQKANLGKRNDQHFVQIPHARLIAMLTYKAELVGITVTLTEESYTSQASQLDLDPLPVYNRRKKQPAFSGKRVKRGLYRASDGRVINADCNGSGNNIIRKVAPDAFSEAKGVEGGKAIMASLVVHPGRLVIPPPKPKREILARCKRL
jgi:putative transposase